MIDREEMRAIAEDALARGQAWLDGKEEREKRERLRDTFAAAALTGMMASPVFPVDIEQAATYSYRIADSMLRERERTNHDAAPAAKAQNPATGSCPTCEGCCTGNTQEPVAWAVLHKDHQYVSLLREMAEARKVYSDAEVVPLYRSPTLTDEEREAVAWCLSLPMLDRDAVRMLPLRSLLDRLA
jgi:hypothetical protein